VRALFLTGSLGHGGAEHHTITLVNRLAERGHECYLAYVKPECDQLPRVHLPASGATFSLRAERYLDFRALRRLAVELWRIQPSVVVAANPYALMYATLARGVARLRAPLVLIYHSTRWPGLKQQAQLLAYRPAIWAADCTVFVCEYQRRYCARRALLSRHNAVIHNGVDTRYFQDHWSASERQELRAALGYADTDYVVGIAAALRPEKNHVQLVEAVARLRQAGLPAKALLIGDGPTRGAVEARARALGVEPHVTITGFRDDVRPCLSACDVVCVCSLTEALSLAAIEAMATGKPLVHSQVGGAGELIDPGSNGLLFPRGDTDALVERLSQLADRDTRLAMGRSARAKVEAAFTEEAMTDRYEQLLLGICRPTRTRRARPRAPAGPAARRPVALLLGPRREALSGVSTHVSLLLSSHLAEEFALLHFEVGSEGRDERALGRAWRLIVSPFRLAAAVLAHRATIVHLNTALTVRAFWRDLAYAIVAKLCGARLLYQVHGGPVPQAFCGASRVFAAFVRWTLRLPDAIVTMSRAEREAFVRFAGTKAVFAFPNAIDCAPYAGLSRRGSAPHEPLRLLYIGRLVGEKGLSELLEALSLARAGGVETVLVIAGAGPQENALRKLVAAQHLRHVHFVGPVRGATRMSVLERADVFVLPSYAEGLPYALLESMAAGVPAIATRVGAIPDLVDDGVSGVLIEPRSARTLAAAICRLAGDRGALERMGRASRAAITARYSIGRLAAELCGVYEDLCARAARQRVARARPEGR
jgi:glycosyltransferase involved in cell wall biosynthesis